MTTDGFVDGVTEQALGTPVPARDVAVQIHGDDRLVNLVEDLVLFPQAVAGADHLCPQFRRQRRDDLGIAACLDLAGQHLYAVEIARPGGSGHRLRPRD